MVHQAVGRGTLFLANDKVDQVRRDTVLNLAHLLSILLPKSEDETILQIVGKIVDRAVNLKMAMTEEQALFRCYWIDCGKEFNDDLVEVTEDQTSGRIFVCTFPGLARVDDESKFIVVRASAMSESALGSQH